MELMRYFDGILTVELVSANISAIMSRIQSEGFAIWNIETYDPFTVRFQISRRKWKKLKHICQKREETIRILAVQGVYKHLVGLKRRPVLMVGLAFLLIFSLWIPGQVFFVRVEGNTSVPTRQIVEAAANCGIAFGASRREVRSEKVKNALLETLPQLSWAGVNTNGCVAIIMVRERDEMTPAPEKPQVSSIVASRDGVIRQLTVLKGSGLCRVGQAVRAGEVLISGYTDCGLMIQAAAAQGEVFAETKRALCVISPKDTILRGDKTATVRKFSLIFGKKRINFSNSSGILGAGCAKIYEENYVSLPGGFVLPLAIAMETWTFHTTESGNFPDLQQVIHDFVHSYLPEQMLAGKILQSDEAWQEQEDAVQLLGDYWCYEMIGITRIEENIPNYGKTG